MEVSVRGSVGGAPGQASTVALNQSLRGDYARLARARRGLEQHHPVPDHQVQTPLAQPEFRYRKLVGGQEHLLGRRKVDNGNSG